MKAVAGEGVSIEIPESLAVKVTGAAVSADVLQLMPATGRRTAVLAAAEFEPTGTVIPEGAVVTWKLPQAQSAGKELWIVQWDRATRKWYGTGDKAKVDSSGASAKGPIYHFSPPVGVTPDAPEQFAPSAKPVPVDPNGRFTSEKDKDKNPRVFYTANVQTYDAFVIDKAKKEAGLRAYDEIAKAKGREGALSYDDFKRLVKETDYAVVKSLIEDGTISSTHNHQLGDWRIHAMLDNLKKVVAEMPGVKVYRSDTGNQKNAYLSDIDQTLFAYKQNEKGEWVRWPEGDQIIKSKLLDRLQKEGLPAAKMEVETMPGKDRFIDERIVGADLDHLLPGELVGKPREVIVGYSNASLGFQPGAYFLAGTVKQQMVMRVRDQAMKHLQGVIHPDPRPIAVPEVQQELGRLNGQCCTEIGPVKEGSKEIGIREGTYEDARQVIMDGLEPELQRGWAYDTAVDSHIKFNEKLKYTLDPHKCPPVKHLLRNVDCGMAMLARMEGKTKHAEYASLNDAERVEYLKAAFGADLAEPRTNRWDIRDGTSFLDRWKEALDISAELRNVTDKEERPVTQADLDKAFKRLAEKMAGPGNEAKWKEFLPQARQEYNARAQEIITHSIVAGAKERILGWLSPDPTNPSRRENLLNHIDESEIRRAYHLEDPKFDATWREKLPEITLAHAATARVQLMYSFRYMKPEMVEMIIRQAESNPKLSAADVEKVRNLAREAAHPLFHVTQYAQFPSLYHQYIKEWARFNAERVAKRVSEHILHEIGYIDTSAARRQPNPVIQRMGLDGADATVHEFFKKYNKTAGFGMRFVKNTVMNVGNVDGIGQVLKDWSASNGDPDVIQDAIIRETINAMPIVGQVVSFANCRSAREFGMTGALMAAALYTPVAGQVMMLFSLGETGVAIYQSDVRAPMAHAVSDALYRGYCGPSLYNFGPTPAQFTDADKDELSMVQGDLRMMKWTFEKKESMVGLQLREKTLLVKKERWNAWVAEQSRNEGGALTGTAAQFAQKPLELEGDPEFPNEPKWMGGPMLARVSPIVLFTATKDGPVDFEARPLTDAERSKMESLKAQAEKENNSPKQFQLAAEIEKLAARQEAYDRSQRYLEFAKKNRELMHQIRLDSLWPYICRDESHDMVSAPRFVDEWIALRRDKIVAALAKLNIEADYKALRDAKEELSGRLAEDVTRSRERWEPFENFRKGREKMVAEQSEDAQSRSHAEALMMWVEDKSNNFSDGTNAMFREAGLDPEYTPGLEYLGEAIMNRHRPLSTPRVRIGGTFLTADPDAKTADGKTDRFRPAVNVGADPTVFIQPYSYSVSALFRDEVKSAVSSRVYKGLPVDDKMIESLQKYLKAYPEPKDAKAKKAEKAPPAYLVYVWCDDFKKPERVVPRTAAGVPELKKYAVPEGKKQAYLLGGGALWAELTPGEPGGPIVVRRDPLGRQQTEILVTDEALRLFDSPSAAKNYPQVQYTIQAATSKDGPWVNTAETTFYNGNCKIGTPKPGDQHFMRIAENRALLIDGFLSITFEKNNMAVEPLWYRVVTEVSANFKPTGKTATSDPVPPKKTAHIHVSGAQVKDWGDWPETDRQEIAIGPGENPSINIALGVDNQAFFCPGAHFTFRESGRTLHYWNARIEGDIKFGSSGGYRGLDDLMITMTLPDRPTEIVLDGEWRDYRASRTFKVAQHDRPDHMKYRQQWVADRLKEMNETKRTTTLNVAGYQREIANMQARLAERAKKPPTNYRENERYLDAELRIADAEYQIRLAPEYTIPQAEVRYEMYQAEFERDWPGIAQTVRKDIRSREKAVEIRKAYLNQRKSVLQRAAALPGAPPDVQKQIQWTDQDLVKVRADLLGPIAGAEEESKWVALSGDAQLLRELFDLRIEMYKETRKNTGDKTWGGGLGQIYYYNALYTALTVGDRDLAAAYFTEFRRLSGKPLLDPNRELPAWWPEGKREVPLPSEKPGDKSPASPKSAIRTP